MLMAEIRDRIVDQCPSFQTVTDIFASSAQLALPAAIVGPLKFAATPNKFMGATIQSHQRVYSILIVLRRSQDDDLGNAPRYDFDTLSEEVRAALVGWLPSGENAAPLDYAGGQIDRSADGLIGWREDFVTTFPVRTP